MKNQQQKVAKEEEEEEVFLKHVSTLFFHLQYLEYLKQYVILPTFVKQF